ncbi:ABC transporter, ATP-binding protein [Paracholeplasma brassicae]|uniref:ABC transporter, ATP-binding protein n=1 Tax=Acholeplasma brassicae TaxID=61635 RepID=U4KQ30_9MOLU|nr:ABC transporter ATP-binding protein [Paracholeplasma brassicae]CCV66520.1 ABC transporter, ATP-binding protein [Paracholeplasma brassicae]
MTKIIEVANLTKSYGQNKGVFNLSFEIFEGEVYGFLGPNGAGKTTTIRQLLGFIFPQQGEFKLFGKCLNEAELEIKRDLGYLPGEIVFFEHMRGIDFLNYILELRGLTDRTYMMELITYFELDASGYIKKMSKGMKQKLGLVCCFMHQPKLLILDEPTSGLDPLMQKKFIDLIKQKKREGATIFMSSHSFEEIEKTCDRVLIIKEGRKLSIESIDELKNKVSKTYLVSFKDLEEKRRFLLNDKDAITADNLDVMIRITTELNKVLLKLSTYDVTKIELQKESLERLFIELYETNALESEAVTHE